MPALLQQPPEPLARRARLQAHPHLALQPTIKLRRLRGMQQLLLSDLSRLIVKDHHLLKPRMEITAYNPHGWLLPGSSAFFAKTDYPSRGQPRYEIKRSVAEPRDLRLLRPARITGSRGGVQPRRLKARRAKLISPVRQHWVS